MSNELATKPDHDLARLDGIEKLKQRLTEISEKERVIPPQLSFKDGVWYASGINVSGGIYVARGFQKWVGGKFITEAMVPSLREDPPDRQSLGDLDESRWERNTDGTRKDPWGGLKPRYMLPMVNQETGELVVFGTNTAGGRQAQCALQAAWKQNLEQGLPIVMLASGSYDNKTHSRSIAIPKLIVQGFDGSVVADDVIAMLLQPKPTNVVALDAKPKPAAKEDPISTGRSLKNDMDDDIPFGPEFR